MMIKKEKNKGEKKREQILEAALECFLEKGYGNASISDIMARAKISKGGIYWYFQCKDEIYVAWLRNGMTGYGSIMSYRKSKKRKRRLKS